MIGGRTRPFLRSAATFLIALAMTLASMRIQRVGAAPAEWSDELCAPEPLHSCRAGVLTGGWPAGFLLDRPGVSVMGKLALIEDLFRPGRFVLDWALAWTALELAALAARRRRTT
jgi:hypothetical protein